MQGTTRTLTLLFVLEAAYLLPARTLGRWYYGGVIDTELVWTGLRLASALAVGLCFRRILWPRGSARRTARIGWRELTAAVVVTGMAALAESDNFKWPVDAVFAATSLAVGLREEMVYRGVLQTVLTEKYGLWAALVMSNVLFIFYHYGAIPFTPYSVWQFFAMGTILGLIYHRTGSLLFVMLVHAGYDAVQCFTPLAGQPLGKGWAALILLAVLAALAAWTKEKRGGAAA